MARAKKRLPVKKAEKAYVSIFLIKVIDTWEKEIKKEVKKKNPKKKVTSAFASQIIGEVLLKNPSLFKNNKAVLNKYMKPKRGNFYLNIGSALILFNLISLFFIGLLLFSFTFLEYTIDPINNITTAFFTGNSFWTNKAIALVNLMISIPNSLDNFFLMVVSLLVIDLVFYSYKTKSSSWWGFFFFMSIGFAIWTFLMMKLNEIKIIIVSYLSNAFVSKPATPFFDYITNNSVEFSAVIFIFCIIVNKVDWNNLRDKFKTSDLENEETLYERFEQ